MDVELKQTSIRYNSLCQDKVSKCNEHVMEGDWQPAPPPLIVIANLFISALNWDILTGESMGGLAFRASIKWRLDKLQLVERLQWWLPFSLCSLKEKNYIHSAHQTLYHGVACKSALMLHYLLTRIWHFYRWNAVRSIFFFFFAKCS